MTISLQTIAQYGAQYTLAFQPTGLGNPFDSSQGWYNGAPSYILVSNVNMNGGLITTDEIDVTFAYNDPNTSRTLADIAADYTNAMGGLLYGYQAIGAAQGASAPAPSTSNTGLGLIGNSVSNAVSGASSTIYWVAGGLLALALGFLFVRKEA